MLQELLQSYDLPILPKENTRETCLHILQEHEYGHLPLPPLTLHWEVMSATDRSFAGGKTTPTTVRLFGETAEKRGFSFLIHQCLPNDNRKHPFFIHLNFRPDIPDKYQPTEEIIDNGFAVLTVCYHEVTSDNDDFTNGIAGTFFPDGVRYSDTSPGKIALWAWAAMRAMDYAHAALQDRLDFGNAGIAGHSRLGKTALLTGAYDSRFSFVFSNCAGCSGDALERNKTKSDGRRENRCETIADITKTFPYWFCKKYATYALNPTEMPFDQHFLTACIAPRNLLLVSALEDNWADPRNQFMNTVSISGEYEKYGKKGIICPDRLPREGDYFADGNVGFSYRSGCHSQNRTDWLHYMDFFKRHMKN